MTISAENVKTNAKLPDGSDTENQEIWNQAVYAEFKQALELLLKILGPESEGSTPEE